MIPLLYFGGAAAAAILMTKNAGNPNASEGPKGVSPVTGRPANAVTAANGTPIKQTTNAPKSAQAVRADQGAGANQPWYTGALVAGGGLALAGVAKALTGMFTSSAQAGENTDSNSNYWDGVDDELDADWQSEFEDDAGYDNQGSDDDSSGYDDFNETEAYDDGSGDVYAATEDY